MVVNILFIISAQCICRLALYMFEFGWVLISWQVNYTESDSNYIVPLRHFHCSGVDFIIPIDLEWLLKLCSYRYSYCYHLGVNCPWSPKRHMNCTWLYNLCTYTRDMRFCSRLVCLGCPLGFCGWRRGAVISLSFLSAFHLWPLCRLATRTWHSFPSECI